MHPLIAVTDANGLCLFLFCGHRRTGTPWLVMFRHRRAVLLPQRLGEVSAVVRSDAIRRAMVTSRGASPVPTITRSPMHAVVLPSCSATVGEPTQLGRFRSATDAVCCFGGNGLALIVTAVGGAVHRAGTGKFSVVAGTYNFHCDGGRETWLCGFFALQQSANRLNCVPSHRRCTVFPVHR